MCTERRGVHLEMRQPDSERIRRVGLRCLAQLQQSTHHKPNLSLLGRAMAYDRLFYPPWRIFENRQSVLSCGKQGGSASSTKRDRSARVLNVNEALYRARFGPVIAYQFVDLSMDFH
jgi:hypothetical protein